METNGLLTLLLDRSRLAVAGALAVRARTTAELVDVTGLDSRSVLSAGGNLYWRSGGRVTSLPRDRPPS